MSDESTLQWLADLQASFGAMLRTPLAVQNGRLEATTTAYTPELMQRMRVSDPFNPSAQADQRLAVYQRQYWFRFFSAFQTVFPLAAHVMGYWSFNRLVEEYLLRTPPQSVDLQECALAFADNIVDIPQAASKWGALKQEWSCCRQALVIDRAFARLRQVERAQGRHKLVSPTRLTAVDTSTQPLQATPIWTLVAEDWHLVARRNELNAAVGKNDEKWPRLQPRSSTQWWLVVAAPEGPTWRELSWLNAELLQALQRYPLAQALAHLEDRCPSQQRASLTRDVQNWLALSVRNGFWRGIGDG